MFPAFLLVLEEGHASNDGQNPHHQQNDHANGNSFVCVGSKPRFNVLYVCYSVCVCVQEEIKSVMLKFKDDGYTQLVIFTQPETL